TIGRPLVEVLLRAGYRVTLRPHPQTRRMNPRRVDSLVAKFGQHPRFRCEADVVSQESLHASDLMISDWSGAALDYALGLERPVLFLDVPRKVNNPDFARLDIVPFEDRIRRDIGAVVAPDRLDDIPDCVQPLISDPHRFRARIGVVRSRWVYNVGSSGARGAERILELAAESERPCQDTRSRG
ncbi:MAG: hypothetical protein GWO40_17935, partial [Gammaproteobacteria bacterium]|nr:hypothetical protein [Gammaproteobacteria bacterium]NIX87404.1 hypothetical protein [Gammaproteobacteria bacterium]